MSANERPSTDPNPSATKSEPQQTLALPSASDTTKVDISSGQGTAKLDHLGPMVVNTDGTLSRITNWETMTEMEQKNTLRIISKRNKQRLDALKASNTSDDTKSESS
jgi:hypothetical protein